MRVILIDDEYLALRRLEDIFKKNFDEVEVIAVYQNALQAYEEIKLNSPDVVFLDIEMPGVNGLELAERIQEIDHKIEIVFVTGYNKYAIEAFELFAFDYMLKPILINRLNKTVNRLKQRLKNDSLPLKEDKDIYIQCFNQIKVIKDGGKAEVLKWRTTKAQELFAYLFHNRDKIVNRETLMDLLWPNTNNTQQLYTTIYQIRRTLKKYGLGSVSIKSSNGGYILSVENIRIDIEEWEHNLYQLEPLSSMNRMEHEQVFNDYQGDYLGDYGYLWAEGEKERYRRLWLNHGLRLSRFYQEKGNNEYAINILQKMQKVYPENEEIYFELMKIYASMNRITAVEKQYLMLCKLLSRELDVVPSQVITNWYENWKREKYYL
ncbi:response regulator [Paucisalibacillus sp. EB02]|uniref:response regulator n=1 Tax=Paucisalibacillus sp. EB02 TaxID=1347087 RepID=UPI0004BA47E2|nr:response regulator [Paucisalibacillus sp. EB02]